MMGMGSHQSANMKEETWLTPPEILEALGTFDLDPCSPIQRPWDTAKNHYTIMDDGLKQDWFGRVCCNPPYGRKTGPWLARLADHGSGIALIFARTETAMFVDEVWSKATAMLFIYGRLHFHHIDGTRAKANSGAPSVLIAYSEEDAEILYSCGIEGKYIKNG
jgi:hypothetical protein